jgi:hypothetical protein
MIYNKVLFQYKNQLCYLVFSEITAYDLSHQIESNKKSQETAMSYYDKPNLKIDNELIHNYISKWFGLFIKEELNFEMIKIIGCLDNSLSMDNITYYILIDEKEKKIIYDTNELVFDDLYNDFIKNNNLWSGNDFDGKEFDCDNYIKISKEKNGKKSIKTIITNHLKVLDERINFLDKIIDCIESKDKKNFYLGKKALQYSIKFNFTISNYKKINLEHLLINDNILKLYKNEKRINETYSLSTYYIEFENYSITYKKAMVDDGHDYYTAHGYKPDIKYDVPSYDDKYYKKLLNYIMENTFGQDADESYEKNNIDNYNFD